MATSPEMCEELEISRQEEIDLLEAIYINELTLGTDDSGNVNTVTLLLHPATGENAELQYVCLTLEFRLPPEYPTVCPDMMIRNPRGLSDEHLSEVRDGLHKLADDRKGNPMLYELIEHVKESLTQSNVPHGSCIICLEPFVEGQAFTKTACYHYFHTGCLVRYIQHSLSEVEDQKKEVKRHQHLNQSEVKSIVCPICRIAISFDPNIMDSVPDSESTSDLPPLSEDIRRMQSEMAKLFLKQKEKGGIIDIEAEKNKYLVTRDTVLIIPAEQPAPCSSGPSDPSPEDPTDDIPNKKNNRRRMKKSGKPVQDDTKGKVTERSNDPERAATLTKEEADLNRRRLMNQRRRNNQQQLRNQQRTSTKEQSHQDEQTVSVSVAEKEIQAKTEQLHLEKTDDNPPEQLNSKDPVASYPESDTRLDKTNDTLKKEKVFSRKNWGYSDKGRFSGGRGRGRGADKSWASSNRDGKRSEPTGEYGKREQDFHSTAGCHDSESMGEGPARNQGRAGRGRGKLNSQGANGNHQRAAPGSSRPYHQRDYRQNGGYERGPRYQKQWDEGEEDGRHHRNYDEGYWDDADQFKDRAQGGQHYQDRARPYRKGQDYYGQPRGRGYRGNYYRENYNSSSDYRRTNGYSDERHMDSNSDGSYASERMNDHYRGNRHTGGFGHYSQNHESMAFSSNSSR